MVQSNQQFLNPAGQSSPRGLELPRVRTAPWSPASWSPPPPGIVLIVIGGVALAGPGCTLAPRRPPHRTQVAGLRFTSMSGLIQVIVGVLPARGWRLPRHGEVDHGRARRGPVWPSAHRGHRSTPFSTCGLHHGSASLHHRRGHRPIVAPFHRPSSPPQGGRPVDGRLCRQRAGVGGSYPSPRGPLPRRRCRAPARAPVLIGGPAVRSSRRPVADR